MRIYISGKITGTNDYMEKFAAAEAYLSARGYEVINPAAICAKLPASTTYEQYMQVAYVLLDMADAVFMLDNWDQSKGSCIEYGYALAKSKTILTQKMEDGKVRRINYET